MTKSRDEMLAISAKRRAAVVAFLNNRKPQWYSTREISDELKENYPAFSYLVPNMAKSKLIQQRKKGERKEYAANGTPVLEPKVKNTTKVVNLKSKEISYPQDIELVIGGVVIVVGRNKDTGRRRILISED